MYHGDAREEVTIRDAAGPCCVSLHEVIDFNSRYLKESIST